ETPRRTLTPISLFKLVLIPPAQKEVVTMAPVVGPTRGVTRKVDSLLSTCLRPEAVPGFAGHKKYVATPPAMSTPDVIPKPTAQLPSRISARRAPASFAHSATGATLHVFDCAPGRYPSASLAELDDESANTIAVTPAMTPAPATRHE